MPSQFDPFRISERINRLLLMQELNQESLMSALSDGIAALVANDANLSAGIAKLATDNAKALSDLQAAIAAAGANSPDVQAAVAALATVNTDLQGMGTNVASQDAASIAADPVQPAPAPAPAPTPST